MLLRPRFKGNTSISTSDYKGPEMKSILGDEAYLLGVLHASSLSNPADYLKVLSGITQESWSLATAEVASEVSDAFETLN